jgi:signal transduction histidine kinase
MTPPTADRVTIRRRRRDGPWSPRAWARALYLAGGIPALLLVVLIVLLPDVTFTHGLVRFLPGIEIRHLWWPIRLVALVVVFFAAPMLTRLHRYRLRVTAEVDIPPPPGVPDRLSRRGVVAALRSEATWRQLCYHVLAAPALAAAALVAVGTWLGGLLYALVYTYAWRMPREGLLRRGQSSPAPDLPRMLGVPVDVYLTLIGIALLAAAPWLTAAVTALDVRAARALLGPSRAEVLEHRVERLTKTRAGVVDAADAERRRLERDLHDGTQQRLVSLAMRLGMARADQLGLEQARLVITEAHEETKAALTELRNLVRGLHPPVLEDRGLDAALSGVAARVPIPVRLSVDVPRRPPATIEAVAYFVVTEGLTNITKHAQASQAEVVVLRAGDRLHIIVSDDGVGGADPARGTGLAGLAKRAESVDGTFEIASPPGGPTLLTVDLPCVR